MRKRIQMVICKDVNDGATLEDSQGEREGAKGSQEKVSAKARGNRSPADGKDPAGAGMRTNTAMTLREQGRGQEGPRGRGPGAGGGE